MEDEGSGVRPTELVTQGDSEKRSGIKGESLRAGERTGGGAEKGFQEYQSEQLFSGGEEGERQGQNDQQSQAGPRV